MRIYSAWASVVIAPVGKKSGDEKMRYSEQFMEHIEYTQLLEIRGVKAV